MCAPGLFDHGLSSPLIVYLACSVQATADNCHGNHVLPPLLHAAVICAAGQICEYLLPGIFEITCHLQNKVVVCSNFVDGKQHLVAHLFVHDFC
jgi:hypothetical protein